MRKVDTNLYDEDIIQKIREYQEAFLHEKEAASEASSLEEELISLGVKSEDLDKDWD